MLLTGISCIAILPLNVVLSSSHAFMANNLLVTVVDISFFVIGLFTVYATQRINAKRFTLAEARGGREVTA